MVYIRLLELVALLLLLTSLRLQAPSWSTSAFVLNKSRNNVPRRTGSARYGLAGDMARGLGRLLGNSEWKKVPEAFMEGMEESEINARARNAKEMEALPPELPAPVAKDGEDVVDSGVDAVGGKVPPEESDTGTKDE